MTMEIRLAEWECSSTDDPRLLGCHFDEHPQLRPVVSKLAQKGQLNVQELRTGLLIEAYAHVGRLDLGTCSVVIEPKLPMPLFLRLLQFAYGFRKVELFDGTQHQLASKGLQELLILQLLDEAGHIIARGMRRTYRREQEPLSAPRGKMLFKSLANARGWGNAELECAYHDRSANNALNRALLNGLELAARTTNDVTLRARAKRMAVLLIEEVDQERLDVRNLHKLHKQLDRQSQHYGNALQLIQLLFGGTGVVLGEAESSQMLIPGFLFDMNRFYQALLSRFLHTFLKDYEVLDEESIKGMFSYRSNRSKGPRPRPDFIVLSNGEVVGVFDAKYRDLANKSLPREMLYQLSIYALSGLGPGKRAIILYPSVTGTRPDEVISINDPLTGSQLGEVVLRSVDLIAMEAVINEADPFPRRRRGIELARELIYGQPANAEREAA